MGWDMDPIQKKPRLRQTRAQKYTLGENSVHKRFEKFGFYINANWENKTGSIFLNTKS